MGLYHADGRQLAEEYFSVAPAVTNDYEVKTLGVTRQTGHKTRKKIRGKNKHTTKQLSPLSGGMDNENRLRKTQSPRRQEEARSSSRENQMIADGGYQQGEDLRKDYMDV